jgi:putative ABC transport system permease protein
MTRLGVRPGDRVQIGDATFILKDAADRIPGSTLNFNPVPRVLIDYDALPRTGLTALGSRVRYYWLFKTTGDGDGALVGALDRALRPMKLNLGLSGFRGVESWLNQSFANLQGFTSLAALSMLVLGGIGVASVTRVFIQQRVDTVAILKCVGGRNGTVLGAYIFQSFFLALAGTATGLALAALISAAGTRALMRWSPLELQPGLTWRAALGGSGIALAITVLFALPALLEIRHVKPVLLFRRDATSRRFDPLQITARVVLIGAILLAAFWQAGSYRNSRWFIVSVATTAIVLNLAGTALLAVLSRVRRLPSFTMRYAVGNLCRPGNQTKAVIFAVGLGTLFLVSVRQQQVNVESVYDVDLTALSADMFAVDLQPDQRDTAEAALTNGGAANVTLIPVVRTRVVDVKWTGSSLHEGTEDLARRRARGGRRASYRSTLESSETVVAGKYWDATPSTSPEVSLEESTAHWMMAGVGDTVVFDVAGRRLPARVTSLRRIERRDRSLNGVGRFDVLFRPGVLEAAPHTFVAAAQGPADGAARAKLQNAFVDRFPNVTLIDAVDEIASMRERIARISSLVAIVGGFVQVCGVLILAGSIAVTRTRRLYEAAILKALGARRLVLARIAAVEFAVLGLVAGFIGSASSIGVTWVMVADARSQIPWRFMPAMNAAGVAATVALVTTVGILSTWSVLIKKPLPTLREQ